MEAQVLLWRPGAPAARTHVQQGRDRLTRRPWSLPWSQLPSTARSHCAGVQAPQESFILSPTRPAIHTFASGDEGDGPPEVLACQPRGALIVTCCGAPAGGRRGAQAWPGYPHHLPSTSRGTLKRTLGILSAAGGGPSLSTDRPGARWASRPSAPRPPRPLPRIRALEPSVLF